MLCANVGGDNIGPIGRIRSSRLSTFHSVELSVRIVQRNARSRGRPAPIRPNPLINALCIDNRIRSDRRLKPPASRIPLHNFEKNGGGSFLEKANRRRTDLHSRRCGSATQNSQDTSGSQKLADPDESTKSVESAKFTARFC